MRDLGRKYVPTNNDLIDIMHIVFENRFRHLDFLYIWVSCRMPYMTNAEGKALRSVFEKEYNRSLMSIPPIVQFQHWIDCMNDVKKRYDNDDVVHNRTNDEMPR